jgi:hypothetical protein
MIAALDLRTYCGAQPAAGRWDDSRADAAVARQGTESGRRRPAGKVPRKARPVTVSKYGSRVTRSTEPTDTPGPGNARTGHRAGSSALYSIGLHGTH